MRSSGSTTAAPCECVPICARASVTGRSLLLFQRRRGLCDENGGWRPSSGRVKRKYYGRLLFFRVPTSTRGKSNGNPPAETVKKKKLFIQETLGVYCDRNIVVWRNTSITAVVEQRGIINLLHVSKTKRIQNRCCVRYSITGVAAGRPTASE